MHDDSKHNDNIQDLYYTIIEQSPSSILMTDVQGRIEYANPKYLELTGYTLEELIGKKPNVLKSGYTTEEEYRILWETVMSGGTWKGLLKNRRKNGEFFWEEATISPVKNERGEIIKLIGLKNDCTKEKDLEAENRKYDALFKKLFENALTGIFVMMLDEPMEWDRGRIEKETMSHILKHLKVTMANQAMADQYRTTKEKLIGLTLKDFFKHDMYESHALMIQFMGMGYLEITTDERKFDGTPMWILGSYTGLYDEEHRIIGQFGMQLEITDLINTKKNLEEEILRSNELKKEADRANAAKSLFLANVSHELRTPINAIIGFSQLALDSSSRGEQRKYLQHIMNASKDLLRIVNDLLDLSRAEANKLPLDEKPFELRKVVGEVLQQSKVLLADKPILLSDFIAPEIPKTMIGDETRIAQILRNLLFNAIKYTDQGTVKLTASLKKQNRHWVELEFEVRDTGRGIRKQRMKRIFEPFSTPEIMPASGAGLGLPLVKALVDLMEGRIWVVSEPGAGSAFAFTIRLKKDSCPIGEYEMNESRRKIDAGELASRLSGAKILLAEDNLLNQQIVLIAMSKVGAHVTVAENGIHCLETLKTQEFDAVLMDLQMPVMDGYETTLKIRESRGKESLPIIAMTANALAEEKKRCLDAGMNDYISKPFMMEELYRVLAAWIRR